MPSLKLNEIFQRRGNRDSKSDTIVRVPHSRKSSLTLSAFNISLTIEKDDKSSIAPSRPVSTVETSQHGPVWWQHRKSTIGTEQPDEEMDQLLKARKMGSAVARRKKALEREVATASVDDLVERTRRELRGGYKSEEEELSDSEENTYSPVIGEDETDSVISTSTDDAASIRQARLSQSIKAKAVPLVASRSSDRRPSGLRLTIDSTESAVPPPVLEEETSAPPSPSIVDPSDVDEGDDYFSILKDDDLVSPYIPLDTPLETATPITYVSPITRPNLISIQSRTPPQFKRFDVPPRSANRPSLTLKSETPHAMETDQKSPQSAMNMILQTVPPSSPLANSALNTDDNSVGVPSVVPHDPTSSAPIATSLDHAVGSNFSSGVSTSAALSRTSSLRRLANKASKANLKRQKSKPELTSQQRQLDQHDPTPAIPDAYSDTATSTSSQSSAVLSRSTSVATTVSATTISSQQGPPYSLFPAASIPNPHHQSNNNTSATTLPATIQQSQPIVSKKSFASLRSLTYTISPAISGNSQNHTSSSSSPPNGKPRGRFPVVPRVDTMAVSARVSSPTASLTNSIAQTPESAYATPLGGGEREKHEDADREEGELEQSSMVAGFEAFRQGQGKGIPLTTKEKRSGGMGLRRVMGQVTRNR